MTKAGEHYIVSLPFQNKSFQMTNNRRQAMERPMYLKVRFKRNPSFFGDYKKLMDDLISKGYARKEDTKPPEDLVYSTSWGVSPKQAWENQSCLRL